MMDMKCNAVVDIGAQVTKDCFKECMVAKQSRPARLFANAGWLGEIQWQG